MLYLTANEGRNNSREVASNVRDHSSCAERKFYLRPRLWSLSLSLALYTVYKRGLQSSQVDRVLQ